MANTLVKQGFRAKPRQHTTDSPAHSMYNSARFSQPIIVGDVRRQPSPEAIPQCKVTINQIANKWFSGSL